jgi:UDP-glucose 4-epimerase
MRVLVVGGAGYIGSHMTKLLADNGHEAVVLDNLSTGFRDAVADAEFVHGDAGDGRLLDGLFSGRRFDAVMHFASFIQVGESRNDPAKYYDNNVARTLVLLDAMVRHRLPCMIFSSSAAVFGEPEYVPIDERHPAQPINPYGTSKWIVERVLADYDQAYGLRHVCLRYFNAAGADPSGLLGERHEPETHLIPLVLRAAAGRLPAIRIFGTDYDTPDGTCIRDYVHIVDLCQAHLLALERLASGAPSAAYNLGNGNGFSVREIISAAALVTGATIPVETAPRRAGDPARLVADASAARRELGWQPAYAALETIIAHAWNWERRAGALPAEPHAAVRS